MGSFYEPLFRHVLFPAYESILQRRKTLHYLKQYEQGQWRSTEEIEALQWTKLQALIAHCWEHVPYYRKAWKPLGISGPGDIASPADYARLPVLRKPEIRENFDSLIARTHRRELLYKTTGGSTGEPLRFGYTRESYERRVAIMWRGYGWSGARLGQRTAYLWGVPVGVQHHKERLYHAAFNRLMLSAFEMDEARMAQYADALDRFRPETIVSYVGPLVAMSEWLIASNRRVHRPQRILGAAESLHEPQRRIIEQAFGAPAFNTYGCREFMLIAAECSHRGGLHVNADHMRVDLEALSLQSGPRDVVVTDLHNYGMPLLRYANGDLATPGAAACACGRGLPLLASVDGRKLDALRTADGRYVPGEFVVYAFLYAIGIKRYQVVQKQLDEFEIRIVRDHDFTEATIDHVRNELMKVVGSGVRLNFQFIEEIPLTPSGKLRVTVSELP